MLRRLSWFTAGLAAGFGGSAWLASRLARARVALTPANLGRTAVLSIAEVLDAAGDRLRNRSS